VKRWTRFNLLSIMSNGKGRISTPKHDAIGFAKLENLNKE